MKSTTPKLLSDAIAQTLEHLGLGYKLKQQEVLELWPLVVGEQIAKIAAAESIRDGKLFITVKHSTWRQELLFLKRELITKINNKMNQTIIKDIIFR